MARLIPVGLVMPSSRGWLHINSWFAVLANIFLLCVALKVWMLTLDEFENLFTQYSATSDALIEAYQEKVPSHVYGSNFSSTVVGSSIVLPRLSL